MVKDMGRVCTVVIMSDIDCGYLGHSLLCMYMYRHMNLLNHILKWGAVVTKDIYNSSLAYVLN